MGHWCRENQSKNENMMTGRKVQNHRALNHQVLPSTSVRDAKAKKEKETKKFKKPKHLTRKLQAAADDQEKSVIEKQLEVWGQRKRMVDPAKTAVRASIDSSRCLEPSLQSEPQPSSRTNQVNLLEEKPKAVTRSNNLGSKDTIRAEASPHLNIGTKGVPMIEAAKPAKENESDEESVPAETHARQRGKRRRGRREVSILDRGGEEEKADEPLNEVSLMVDDPELEAQTKHQKRQPRETSNDTRRCIGRKPVTDYEIGKVYEGKVVYMKPFGIFVDIDCHSDAFCHVSRLRDEFVAAPEELFSCGDTVQARVVEIERQRKRITISLQSESMIEAEQKSLEVHGRQKARELASSKKSDSTASPRPKQTLGTLGVRQNVTEPPTPDGSSSTGRDISEKRQRKLERRAARRAMVAHEPVAPAE
jgi:predicted RNA-binding protein with RPS1 domain